MELNANSAFHSSYMQYICKNVKKKTRGNQEAALPPHLKEGVSAPKIDERDGDGKGALCLVFIASLGFSVLEF
jgi:hypothetical protein